MSRLLDRVAAAHGIELGYTDAHGDKRHATEAAKRSLLAAMGVDAGSDAALKEALARRRAGALPPVLVLRAGEDAVLPLPKGVRGHAWRVALEGGETLAGSARAQATGPEDGILLPAPLPPGYHRLELERPGGDPLASLLVAAPERCLVPQDLGIERCFGIGVQVYGLKGIRDLGSGDLADLAAFAGAAGREGADFVGLNPLHALFFAAPQNRSPYAPSNRRFLNWIYVAPDLVPEVAEDPELRAAVDAAHAESHRDDPELVDYPAVAARRRRLLEAAFATFRERHLTSHPTPRGRAFLDFRREMGEALERHATFEALHEAALTEKKGWAWWEWPEGWRDPAGSDVRTIAQAHADRVTFFCWLQWLAEGQLAEAQGRAKAAGMRIGLYRDLAVGVDPAGSLTWSYPGVAVRGASVGAPPDIFNPKGQNWGLAPLEPTALAAKGFEPWIADIRATMRHAGAIRIDHAIGLKHLYWIPTGAEAGDGAYVRYPFDTMAAILALESHRQGCLVVGEDLGTVPAGFRPALKRAGILGCAVLYFERTASGGFLPPPKYREGAVASVSTHDLPTLKGWLDVHDVDWRERLELFTKEGAADEARADRAEDKQRLVRTLRRAGLLGPERDPDPKAIAIAVHRYLARAASALALVQLEDVQLTPEQPNLPGTIDEHPNWRRRVDRDLADVLASPYARRLFEALREERPRG